MKKNAPDLSEWIFFRRYVEGAENELFVHGFYNIRQPDGTDKISSGIRSLSVHPPIYDEARETKGYFGKNKQGDFTRTSNQSIADAAHQVTIATLDLFARQMNANPKPCKPHILIPVIVTTANLFDCSFSPNDVDPQTGEIAFDKVVLTSVPGALYEYPIPRTLQFTGETRRDFPEEQFDRFTRMHIVVLQSAHFANQLGNDLPFLNKTAPFWNVP